MENIFSSWAQPFLFFSKTNKQTSDKNYITYLLGKVILLKSPQF